MELITKGEGEIYFLLEQKATLILLPQMQDGGSLMTIGLMVKVSHILASVIKMVDGQAAGIVWV